MAIRYAIRHRTTGHYLTVWPSLNLPDPTSLEPLDAVTARTEDHAETERLGIEDFSGAYEVCPLEVWMAADGVPKEEGE